MYIKLERRVLLEMHQRAVQERIQALSCNLTVIEEKIQP
jgi:hypothetical protein